MKNIFLVLLMFICSCTSQNLSNTIKTESKRLKVVKIISYNGFYELTTVKEDISDTLLIISYKKGFSKKDKKTQLQIVEDRYYKFELSIIKPRVSTMEQLGAYMIFGEDTLYRASSSKELPRMYQSHNSLGLYIYE